MSAELTTGQNFTVGTIAAFVEGIILQPTVYWKTARAQRLPFTLDVRVLYRGTGASIFNECQMMGLQFGLTGYFQKYFTADVHGEESLLSYFPPAKRLVAAFSEHEELLSSAFGGCVASLFASPVELVMIQQQIHGLSVGNTIKKIVMSYGFTNRGVMRGVLAASIRDTIYVSGMLGVTPILQYYLSDHFGYSFSTACFYSSLVGGMIAAIPSHPFDCAKTCMQGDLDKKEYASLSHTFRKLWRQGGVRRLFAGCMWRTVNICATVYIANQVMINLQEHAAKIPI